MNPWTPLKLSEMYNIYWGHRGKRTAGVQKENFTEDMNIEMGIKV